MQLQWLKIAKRKKNYEKKRKKGKKYRKISMTQWWWWWGRVGIHILFYSTAALQNTNNIWPNKMSREKRNEDNTCSRKCPCLGRCYK